MFLNNFPTKHKTGLLFFKLNFIKITRNWNEWAHKDRKCIFWKKKEQIKRTLFPYPTLSKNPLGTCIILLIVRYCQSYSTFVHLVVIRVSLRFGIRLVNTFFQNKKIMFHSYLIKVLHLNCVYILLSRNEYCFINILVQMYSPTEFFTLFL